ncbi:MAG: replication initiation protein [Bacteroidaceae bacterium]|nr:replication initiation protein [Bacteroidaceae bacterium]
MENEIILCQSNMLTESRYSFSRIEKKCIYLVINKVRQDYVEGTMQKDLFDNMRVEINSSDLALIAGEDNTKHAKDALRALRHRDIEMEDEEGNWLNTGFITMAKYTAKTNTFLVEVSSEIMPHLVELARKFTAYNLTVAMTLKGKYSQRFYELCCQYRNRIEKDGYAGFHKTQQQLRDMFCIENKYAQNSLFNEYVIESARQELKEMYDNNQCDLYFDVNIKGRGKSMCYDFKIRTREGEEARKIKFEDTRKKWTFIYGTLQGLFGKDPKYVERIAKQTEFHAELITPIFEKIQKLKDEYPKKDLAKLLRYILKEDFGLK